jgi:hypothetical protein
VILEFSHRRKAKPYYFDSDKQRNKFFRMVTRGFELDAGDSLQKATVADSLDNVQKAGDHFFISVAGLGFCHAEEKPATLASPPSSSSESEHDAWNKNLPAPMHPRDTSTPYHRQLYAMLIMCVKLTW